MNRRSFIKSVISLGATAAILPAALTYERKWKLVGSLVIPEKLDLEKMIETLYAIKKSRLANPTGYELWVPAGEADAVRQRLLKYYHPVAKCYP